AIRKNGPELLRLSDYFCLASVQLPFGREEIEASADRKERRDKEEVWNQIDLCVTATREDPEEETSQAAARSGLGETCGVEISDLLW
ncbi:unnamed protein product, partial [Polarella glacialis]